MEGPFVNGDQFALLMDMVIVNRTTGERQPFKESAQRSTLNVQRSMAEQKNSNLPEAET